MINTENMIKKILSNKLSSCNPASGRIVQDVVMAVYHSELSSGPLLLEYPTAKQCAASVKSIFTVSKIQKVIKRKYNDESRYDSDPAIAVKWGAVVSAAETAFGISLDRKDIGIFSDRTVVCTCGGHCSLKLEQIGRRRGEYLWLCPDCGASVGVHRGTNIPLGIPVNKDTGAIRVRVHKEIDRLIASGLSKKGVYEVLRRKMNLSTEITHVGMFNHERCVQALSILKEMKGGYRL